MGSKASIAIDREGVLNFSLEVSPDGHLLKLARVAYFPEKMSEPGNPMRPVPFDYADQEYGKLIAEKVSLRRVNTNGAGQINYERFMPPLTSTLEVKPGDKFEWWFDDKIKVGSFDVAPNNITVHQEYIERATPTEIRLAFNNSLPKLLRDPAELSESAPRPTTDLHTHFAGIMTADILIKGIRQKLKDKKSVNYPVKYLLVAGIKLEDLKMYFKTDAEFDKFNADCASRPETATFDITKLMTVELIGQPQNESNLAKLRNILHIPADKTIVFNDMEKYYTYRDALVKDKDLLAFFLEQIASDYQMRGIKYAEISFSKVVDPAWLSIIEKQVPDIEKKYGVTMRFLGIIARTAPKEEREAQVQMFEKFSSKSPYVVGMDLLAAEINSTYDVLPELRILAEWAKTNYPGMVIRVHAGETSYHPENVAGVIELAREYPELKFRVGHGIHGVHDDIVASMKDVPNIIPEINMASNVTLNMQGDIVHHTLFTYIKEGIPVVLGSDGHGLYQSESSDLVKLLFYADVPDREGFLDRLKGVEDAHISHIDQMIVERARLHLNEFFKTIASMPLQKELVPALEEADKARIISLKELVDHPITNKLADLHARFVANNDSLKPAEVIELFDGIKHLKQYDQVWKKMFENYDSVKAEIDAERIKRVAADERARAENKEKFEKHCQEKGIKLLHDKRSLDVTIPLEGLDDKTPVMVSGIISPGPLSMMQLSSTKALIKTMLDHLDPDKYYFATTGTDIGVQRIVHELVHEYNQKHPDHQFRLAAYVPANVKPEEVNDHVTDVVMVDDVPNIYNMYEYIDKRARDEEHGLNLVAIGGGMWNKDVIQIVDNALRDPTREVPREDKTQHLFLLPSVAGASADKAKELPKHYSTEFAEIVPSILARERAVKDNRDEMVGTFKKYAFSDSSRSPLSLLALHGRSTSSTLDELAKKVSTELQSCINKMNPEKKISSEQLKIYLNCRLTGTSVVDTEVYKRMSEDRIFKEAMKRVSEIFSLPAENESDSTLKLDSVKITPRGPTV